MSALDVLRSIPDAASRARVRNAALRLAHPTLRRLPALADSDLATNPDHPALRKCLIDHWWLDADALAVTALIESASDPRANELAAVIIAESVGHLSDDPCVATCRAVRLAWARDEADEDQRDAARRAAWAAAQYAAWASAESAAHAAAAAWAAARSAAGASRAARDAQGAAWGALATPLRILFPDPSQLDVRDALTRWDAAAALARGLFTEGPSATT